MPEGRSSGSSRPGTGLEKPAASASDRKPSSTKDPAAGSATKSAASATAPASTSTAGAAAASAGAGIASDRGAQVAQTAQQTDAALEAAKTAGDAAEAARTAGKVADAASKADKAAGGGLGGAAAGMATEKAIAGNGENAKRAALGRYSGAAVSGGVGGAQAGAAAAGVGAVPGAAVGAAKSVAIEMGKDVVGKAVEKKAGADPADQGPRLGTRAAQVGAVAASPGIAAGVGLALAFAKAKAFLFGLLAAALNTAGGILAGLANAAIAAGKFALAPAFAIGNLVAGAASSVGITSAAVAPVTAATTGLATIASVAVIGGSTLTNIFDPARFDGMIEQGDDPACVAPSVAGGNVGDGAGAVTGATEEKNAQIAYSVLKSRGMPDENIAGILGNWSQESRIDPTSVEGIFDEPHSIGPRKQAAWNGNFTHIPGQSHGGIGLGQWSNGRTPMLLEYARSKGMDWFTIEAQLAFMLQGDTAYDRAQLNKMVTGSMGSPGAAARFFHDNWERSADNERMMQERIADAEMWFAKMSGWSVDASIAQHIDSVIGPVGSTGGLGAGAVGAIGTIIGSTPSCETTGGLNLGGLSQAEAEEMMSTYNSGDADTVLNGAFNGGGPGKDYTGSYVMNCVSFSWYFLIKYAGYTGGYEPGNGKDVVRAMARATGKSSTTTPTTFSIFSHANTSSAGHTGVVLAMDGERIMVGEAAYSSGPGNGYPGRVRWVEPTEWKGKGWTFLPIADMVGDAGGDPEGLELSLGGGPATGNAVVDAARSQIGWPYVWAGGDANGPSLGARLPADRPDGVGYDCSGLTTYSLSKIGVKLPRTSEQQKNAGPHVPKSQASPGDLVWWPGHVGIYAGGDKVIHASRANNKVVESNIWDSPIFVDVTP